MPRCRHGKIIPVLFAQPNEAPVAHNIEIDSSEGYLYLRDIEVLAFLWDADDVQAKVWCPVGNLWSSGTEPISVSNTTRCILVRRDFVGSCVNLGTELHVAQTMWAGGPRSSTLAAMRAERKEIRSRETKEDCVWLVLWHKVRL